MDRSPDRRRALLVAALGFAQIRLLPPPLGLIVLRRWLDTWTDIGAITVGMAGTATTAKEVLRMPGPSGTIGHAEIEIGGSRIMLADEHREMNFRGPKSFGGTTVHMHLYVEDTDKVVNQAAAVGAKILRPVADQFYGDRVGSLEDPFGHVWHVSTHKEDLSPEELKKRAAARASAAGKA